jgi:hypothetical protein
MIYWIDDGLYMQNTYNSKKNSKKTPKRTEKIRRRNKENRFFIIEIYNRDE